MKRATSTVLLLLALSAVLTGQQFTFSPQPALPSIHATVWSVTASGAGTVRPSDVYRAMIAHGLSPVAHDQALDMIHRHDHQSVFRWALEAFGLASSVGGAAAASPTLVKMSDAARTKLAFGLALLPVATAWLNRNQPPPITVEQRLLAGPMTLAADGEAEFLVFSLPVRKAAAWVAGR